jgi:hypothetical protein
MLQEILNQINQIQPQYSTKLPVSGKEISFSPFKIKDQKLISIISQENNVGQIVKNICQILKNCSNIKDPENLYIPDLEFLFLQLRSKSVEEQIKLNLLGEKNISFSVNINEITLKNGLLEEQISLSNGIIIEAEQLKAKDYFDISTINENELIKKSIKSLIINGNKYDLKVLKVEEIQQIVNEISIKDEKLLKTFLNSSPSLYYVNEINGEKVEIEGFLRFFI